MIPDDRLTAYALNDPGLDGAERAEIEQALAADAALAAGVAETRRVAALLADGLARELPPVVAPAPKPQRNVASLVALAASVLLACGVVGYAWVESNRERPLLAKVDVGEVTPSDSRNSGKGDDKDLTELDLGLSTHLRPSVQPANGDEVNPTTKLRAMTVTEAKAIAPATVTKAIPPTAHSVDMPALAGSAPKGASPTVPYIKNPAAEGARHYYDPLHADPNSTLWNDRRVMDDSGKVNPGYGPPVPGEARLGGMFDALEENPFVKVEGKAALSTFGLDVDTASYSIVRRFLNQNQMPPAGAVRLEELVNYFPYRDAAPAGDDPFAVTVELAECPWNPKNRLARIGVKAKTIDFEKRPPSNLVFLIDVSGSMQPENKLPLVKQSLKLLVNQLGENDRVALVVYASGTGVVLDSTSAMKKDVIIGALDKLSAGGSTAGASGIQLAYDTAIANFIPGGTNRVILCTDGDWNVGVTGTDDLVKMIEEKRKSNVFLSVFGFGFGNLRDEMMVKLAGKGNGQYAYIDDLKEARKAFVEQAGGTLVTVAKDVKIQVEFNPVKVGSFRLLGYEKRILAAKDFHDDKKDAGEMGAGHVVTALYELTPAGVDGTPGVEGLRYQNAAAPAKNDSKEAFVVKLRHKLPTSDVSTLREVPVVDSTKPYGEASEDFRFSAAVASFAMLLRDSPFKGNATYAAVMELANAAKSHDPGEYRAEFVKLVEKAKQVSGKP